MAGQHSYIVFGTTGEHSDRREWPVITYSVSMAADQHVANATRWCEEQGIAEGYVQDFYSIDKQSLSNPWDQHMKLDYNGVSYFVKAVPARISSVRPLV